MVAGEERDETKRGCEGGVERDTHKRPEAAHSHCPVIYYWHRCLTFTNGVQFIEILDIERR